MKNTRGAIRILGVVIAGSLVLNTSVFGQDTAPDDPASLGKNKARPTIIRYHITASVASAHGTISPKGVSLVKAGKSKTYIAKPKKGYKAGIKVNGILVATGKIGKPLKYKLVNINSNMTVQALFVLGNQPFPPTAQTLSIAITGLGQSILVASRTPVTIEGFADSDIGIKSVTYSNELNGAKGVASGSNQWSAVVALAVGDNHLHFKAIATDDSSTEIATTLTYYPGLDFTTPLTVSTDLLYVNEATNVLFHIGLGSSSGAIVTLYQTDSNGVVIATVDSMLDDGVLPDEIESDGVFTLGTILSPSQEGFLYFRAGVSNNGTNYYSETTHIWVTSHISDAAVTVAVNSADLAQQQYDHAIAGGKTKQQAAQEVITQFQSDPNIGTVAATPDGGVWWVTKDGILCLYHPDLAGEKAGGASLSAIAPRRPADEPEVGSRVKEIRHYPPAYLADRSQYAPQSAKSVARLAVETPKNEIQSKRAILISPFINNPNTGSNFGSDDDYFVPWQVIKTNSSCGVSATTEALNNGSVIITHETFKNLKDYGVIHISSHGDNFYNGLFSLWKDVWGPNDFLKGSLSQVVMLSGVAIDMNVDGTWSLGAYENDIKLHRVAVHPTGLLALLPGFFTQYIDTLPNSLVVLSHCRSMYNNSMANAFLSRGAGAVVGYSDYVATSYTQNTLDRVYKDMYAGKTVQEAFDDAVATYGSNDADSDPAYFRLAGTGDLVFPGGLLENAGFENGVLTPWAQEGDGRIITQLGSASPTEGSYMAIISTGLGFTVQDGTIEQDFCVSATAQTLTFDWDFFSEEFLEFCGSIYQDSFEVSICEIDDTTASETCTVVFSRKVDDLCDVVHPSDVGFDQGDVYDTGWQFGQTIDLTPYQGKHVKIKFYCTDIGDSIYDTAVLIDNITLTDAP